MRRMNTDFSSNLFLKEKNPNKLKEKSVFIRRIRAIRVPISLAVRSKSFGLVPFEALNIIFSEKLT